MDSTILYSVYAIIAVVSTVSAQPEGTCQTCNCQFNNVQLLKHLIKEEVTNAGISGVTYTRWGRSSCPNDTDAQLVYSGRAGGTNYAAQGGSAERICLPDDPDYIPGSLNLSSSLAKSEVQGVELEVGFTGSPYEHLHNHNAPCAVCLVPTRSTTIVIPAKTECPSTWTREYYGYLMSDYDGFFRSSYVCLDANPEVIPGASSDTNPSLLYHAVTDCNGLACPPYESGYMLSCVVCTK